MTECLHIHRRRRQGQGARAPSKKSGKYFRAIMNLYRVKFRHFSGKCHAKLGNFDHFRANIIKNSAILIFFGQISREIRAFCLFCIHNFRAKMSYPKLTQLLCAYFYNNGE